MPYLIPVGHGDQLREIEQARSIDRHWPNTIWGGSDRRGGKPRRDKSGPGTVRSRSASADSAERLISCGYMKRFGKWMIGNV